jgi:Asp-tRNA(Asn)/Glu-tRNA(Gln) amidotransferase A subunit family amidase
MEFRRASLGQDAAALRNSSVRVMDCITDTMRRVDTCEPLVHALVPEPNRHGRLAREAAALEARYPDPQTRPTLFGIPVGIKDLLRVDGFPTRAGSFLPHALFDGAEASIVGRVRELGGLILGKTETDEFAYSEPSVTRNPRNLKHTPGGSSGGSAAAVALGLTPLALGTQTLRSIVGPASFCGVVGYKPSWGTIPADGLIEMSPSIDTIGLLTQDVESAVLAAELLTGIAPRAPSRRPVLGIIEGIMRSSLEEVAEAAYVEQIARLEAAGIEVRRVQLLEDEWLRGVTMRSMKVLHYEMAEVHRDWFATHAHLYRSRTAQAIRGGQGVDRADYEAAKAFIPEYRDRIADLMDRHGIDLWALPGTKGPAPEGYHVTGSVDLTGTWSYGGLASFVLPAGKAPNGLPLGLQFIPRFGGDAELLGWMPSVGAVFET